MILNLYFHCYFVAFADKMTSENYSVTIMNCCEQRLHTWLVFEPKAHFSFDSPNLKGAITCKGAGVFESSELTSERQYDEKKQFKISKRQYERMMNKISELSTGATYALIPMKEGEYNCVVSSRVVLNAGGIDFLDDVVTPVGVGKKIQGSPSYREADRHVMTFGLIPRASAAITEAVGLSLDNGPWGWAVGTGLALGGAYCLFKLHQNPSQRN